jgi:uncharacterized protein DUF4260
MIVRQRSIDAEDTAPHNAGVSESVLSGPTGPPGVIGQPRLWLRAEGAAAAVVGVTAWGALNGGDVLWLIVWVLAVDISMVGYLAGPRLGALSYNVAHNWATALAVLLGGFVTTTLPLELMGVALVAHVGVDRALGYGLKYPTSFQDTHLGRIGRNRR